MKFVSFLLTRSILVRQVDPASRRSRTSFLSSLLHSRGDSNHFLLRLHLRDFSLLEAIDLGRVCPNSNLQENNLPAASATYRTSATKGSRIHRSQSTQNNLFDLFKPVPKPHTDINDGRQIRCASISSSRPQSGLPITSTSNELRSELWTAEPV